MDEKEKKNLLLRQAKITLNFGVIVLVFCTVWLMQHSIFPTIFDFSTVDDSVISEADNLTPYEPLLELDSADIENGIHVPSGLVVDDGVDIVMTTCGACHSLSLVTQNRATREGWKDIIVWMQETQKLWDLGDNEEIILNYLAKNYAPKDEGRRRNIVVEEWYNL